MINPIKTYLILLLPLSIFINCSTRSKVNNTAPKLPALQQIEVLAENLNVPWGMDFLPDGRLLFTERDGNISVVNYQTKVVTSIAKRNNNAQAEGGLLGLAVDPLFSENHFIFIYETIASGNRIVRLTFENETLSHEIILLDNIPKKLFHNGGILRFGPDGYLYVGTGDAREPENAQDINSNSGKILRMDRNGKIPSDNPFNNYVWSYGHRNVQGLCWTTDGTMYATEHGPSGELNDWCCHDEINTIVKGNNYGWPNVIGTSVMEGAQLPFAQSGDDTWAPGGIIYTSNFNDQNSNAGSLVFACLRGERLVKFSLSDTQNPPQEMQLYAGIYGRLRNIISAPNGDIIFTTSNRDGRGNPDKTDDKIYIIRK